MMTVKIVLSRRVKYIIKLFIKHSSDGVNGFHGILAQSHVAQDLEQDYEPVWAA